MVDDDAKLVSPDGAEDLADTSGVVARYQASLFRFAYNLIGNRQDAEDIVQEVFVAAYRHRAKFDARRGQLSTWLFTIARNRCINFLKRSRLPTVPVDARTLAQPQASQTDARRDFWEALDQALAALPLEQKTVFVLAEIEQLAYREIAEIEATSLGTVKSRLHRAKRALRACLETEARET